VTSPPRATRGWFWAAVALTALKLWLVAGQRVYAIGPSFHDDRLFVELAGYLLDGQWLGPYTQYTLAKGPMYSLFIAATFKLGIPLFLAQHLLYAGSCAAVVTALRPWLGSSAARFICYTALLWNPMSYEAQNLGRVLRQNLYVPLALFVLAGLVTLFTRRREGAVRQVVPAGLAGLAFGAFWLTREESVWLVPAVGLLLLAPALAVRRELVQRWRALAAGVGAFVVVAALPLLIVSTLNFRHYGWFGTVEFRAPEFNDAYGALLRIQTGPKVENVTITRQTREKAYELSPAFARIRPALEGAVGEHWFDATVAPVSERQIRGGWFMWALRDAARVAGVTPDAGAAMRYYRQVADELNAACDAGRVAALPRRSGFLPPLGLELVRPVIDNTRAFTDYFFRFRDFTARPLASLGDYAELKPFRDFIGTRLTPSARSPELPSPERDRRDAWKVETLERIGQSVASLLGLIGPLLLFIGVVRGIESALDRRVSYLLGLAGALLLSCCAYLAINVLIHTTSFNNMTPAALAGAYPLYLVAVLAIATDTLASLRRPIGSAPAAPDPGPVSSPPAAPAARPQPAWLAAAGAALVVFGARLLEIHLHASDVPYNDQWLIEAGQILAPWVNGTLGLGDFFTPHFEHLPVWTRLLAWLQVAITGRWDPIVQMTTNAALYGGFVWCFTAWTWRNFRPLAAGLVTALLLFGGSLPHAWENIDWGFQSQFPLALLFLFGHVQGSCTHPAGSRRWWLAQLAGIAAWFTLASVWLASLALVISWLWTGPRQRAALLKPAVLVPAALAATGALLLFLIHRRGDHAFALVVTTPFDLLRSALHLLSWPSLVPGALALVQLPWLIHALRLRNRPDAPPVDRIILVLGLWGAAQAAALAFGRAPDNHDFVSRYGELLFVSSLAGALALARMVPAGRRERSLFLLFAVLWSAIEVAGIARNSTEGHARYFHLHASERRELGRAAVQAYLKSGDNTLIASPAGKAVFLDDTALVTRMLDLPGIRALLPASVNPDTTPDAFGTFVRRTQARAPVLIGLGVVLLLAGAALQLWLNRAAPIPAAFAPAADPWRWRIAAIVAGAAAMLYLTWSNPFVFDTARRWQRNLGGSEAVPNVTFHFAGPSEFGDERLQGAAPIRPVELRNQFFGTAPAGPELTTTVVSSPFVINRPWLVVPYSGYPVAHGNGLRLRIVNDQDQQVGDEIGCDGPNTAALGFWTVDVRAHRGSKARLILYDGRPAEQGWVAAAPPVLTDNPNLAAVLAARSNQEDGLAHVAVAVIAGVASFCAGLGWLAHRRAVRVVPLA
jgi:hypothetical protein